MLDYSSRLQNPRHQISGPGCADGVSYTITVILTARPEHGLRERSTGCRADRFLQLCGAGSGRAIGVLLQSL